MRRSKGIMSKEMVRGFTCVSDIIIGFICETYYFQNKMIKQYIAAAQIKSFHSISFCCNTDETPQELNSCLYKLAYGRIGFVILCFG